jgi:hypothetical protein
MDDPPRETRFYELNVLCAFPHMLVIEPTAAEAHWRRLNPSVGIYGDGWYKTILSINFRKSDVIAGPGSRAGDNESCC